MELWNGFGNSFSAYILNKHKYIKKRKTMKLNFTRALIALAVVTLSYTACQKSGTKPSTTSTTSTKTTVNEDALAITMATNIYKSMTGGYGGANINQGMQAPQSIAAKGGNKLQLDAVSSLCGYVIDSTYSATTNANDTTSFVSTKFKFVFKCIGGSKVNGYSCYDSVFTQSYNSAFVNTTDVIQDYNVIAKDSTFKLYACDGRIICHNSTLVNPTASAIQVYHAINCDYKIAGLVVDVKNGTPVILAGFATYVCSTNDIDPATGPDGIAINYTGNIIFLGNNLARLKIDPNHIYTINLVTGVITARG